MKTLKQKTDVKKKLPTRYGEISVLKSNNYITAGKEGFKISPYMQELLVYAGHLECYEKSNEILSHFLSVQVSPAQVYRVTTSISESLKSEDGSEERTLAAVSNSDVLYVGVDGSMISTWEEGWKEVKLARLFRGSDCLNPNTENSCLTQSQYVSHPGSSKEFCEKTEQVLDSYGQLKERLIFLTDGAAWIKNWTEDSYPDSYAILDFYHACEHLHEFVEKCFRNNHEKGKEWFEKQKSLLYESSLEKVIEKINATSVQTANKDKLINYYQNNKDRMDYKKYRSLGCGIIGSGSIESAHRTVIQKRMKLSGQHWSKTGAKNMLRLRVISMNKQWHKVIDLLKKQSINVA